MRTLLSAFLFLGFMHAVEAQTAKPIMQTHEFHVSEKGGFTSKTLKEMSKEEFQVLVTAGCAIVGTDCSEEAEKARMTAERLSKSGILFGGKYSITGRIIKHEEGSEEWTGAYDAPPGLEVCNAWLDELSVSDISTFETRISRLSHGRGLQFYAHVPKHDTAGHNWVDATFVVKYVPAGKATNFRCPANRSRPWDCHGPDCNPFSHLRQ